MFEHVLRHAHIKNIDLSFVMATKDGTHMLQTWMLIGMYHAKHYNILSSCGHVGARCP